VQSSPALAIDMRTALLFLVLTSLTLPARTDAQVVSDVMAGIREGGSWVAIPIEDGRGTFSTVTLPTAGMTLQGCVNVWYGHSGTWSIEARERLRGSELTLDAEPGIGVPFSHEFGMRAQIDFDFRWSEARDTTLMLWVGVDFSGEGADAACEPQYGGDG
jgi:hypothetical protein